MEDLHENICKGQLDNILHIAEVTGNDELIQKAFSNLIEKGRVGVVGEIREWNGKKYRKNVQGKWDYVSEGSVNWKEDFVDEDTGEVISINRSGKLLLESQINKIKLGIIEKRDQMSKVTEDLHPLYQQRDKISDEQFLLREEIGGLKDLVKERKQLDSDQEQDIPNARKISPEEEDRVAQEYGEKMNKLDNQIDDYKKENIKRKERLDKLESDYNKLDDKITSLHNSHEKLNHSIFEDVQKLNNHKILLTKKSIENDKS